MGIERGRPWLKSAQKKVFGQNPPPPRGDALAGKKGSDSVGMRRCFPLCSAMATFRLFLGGIPRGM